MKLEDIKTSFDEINARWRLCETQAELSDEIEQLEELLAALDQTDDRDAHKLWSEMNYTQGIMRIQLRAHKEHVHES
jgi:hypothetical protein